MGKCFSDAVEQALQYIYYDMRGLPLHGREGLQLLVDASNAGDADADCILARCFAGSQYVWFGHGFPEDDENATFLLRRSVARGSAIGALVAIRAGELSPQLKAQMPMTLQEAFDSVLQKAHDGDAFCQYTVGNTYFWWDFMRIQQKRKTDFPNQQLFHAYMRDNITQCEGWFQRAFRGGMQMAGDNLFNYYEKGDEDFVAPQPEKAAALNKEGSDLGYAKYMYFHACDLEEAGRNSEALDLFKQAAERGHSTSAYKAGEAYREGKLVACDPAKAVYYYEMGSLLGNIGCCNRLAHACYTGEGTQQDYARAVQLFRYTMDNDNDWGILWLAHCYMEGWGCEPNYQLARQYAEKYSHKPLAQYILGAIYCRGLGVSEDIARGVDYLQKAGDQPNARAELAKYKKTLFGRWVRR